VPGAMRVDLPSRRRGHDNDGKMQSDRRWTHQASAGGTAPGPGGGKPACPWIITRSCCCRHTMEMSAASGDVRSYYP